MIYVTGDTHGEWNRLMGKNFSFLTKEDILIICGDFGYVWASEKHDDFEIRIEAHRLDQLAQLPFLILFVDGNHENFDRLEAFEEVELFGDKVHKIRDNIYHLQRGAVYEIEGKRFFCFGGAASVDKAMRIPGRSWWARELPDAQDYARAEENLKKNHYCVDYIITHTAPTEIIEQLGCSPLGAKDMYLVSVFSNVMHHCSFKEWFFGHFHTDKKLRFVQSDLFAPERTSDAPQTTQVKHFRALWFDVCPIENKEEE